MLNQTDRNPEILLLTPSISENSLGRTYAIWLLIRHLGWNAKVVATQGTKIWDPLANTEFATICTILDPANNDDWNATKTLARNVDLLIAIKPLAASMGIADQLHNEIGTPVIVDVDDPDLFATLATDRPFVRLAKWVLKPRVMLEARARARTMQKFSRMVSNPVLAVAHGGVLIPHVREVPPLPEYSERRAPCVVFVGTNRTHKGINVIRAAVEALAPQGATLIVTDSPPADAKPWEKWVGVTSFAEGQQLVSQSDVTMMPSLDVPWAHGQLPAKLIDAMMLGKPAVVSRIDPLPWAAGDGGIVIPAGDRGAALEALHTLSDPNERKRVGLLARERAIKQFSVASVAPRFAAVCREAMQN